MTADRVIPGVEGARTCCGKPVLIWGGNPPEPQYEECCGHPTEDEAPLELKTCEACDGKGEIVVGTLTIYEHGCAFSHEEADIQPCPECGGQGAFVTESEGDAYEAAPNAG